MKRKVISWLLLIAMLVTIYPANTLSVANASKSGKRELYDQRTTTSKLFDNGDGTFTKQIYFKPRHRKKGDQFQEISNKLVTQTQSQQITPENTSLDIRFLPKMEQGKYVTLQSGPKHDLLFVLRCRRGQWR